MTGNALPLLVTVVLSAIRNITSKQTAADTSEHSGFFFSQTIVFLSSALLCPLASKNFSLSVSGSTVLYGVIYGILLILSQWMLTLALKSGDTSICSVVYSLGFLLPTLSGAIFWGDEFTLLHFVGLLLALVVIFLSAGKRTSTTKHNAFFFPALLTTMFASGGLGIVQKIQQTSPVADETGGFLLIAFAFATGCSFLAFLLCKQKPVVRLRAIGYPIATGLCFGGTNVLNTLLVGRMNSAVFFPVKNIATILLSTLLGFLFFRERFTRKTAGILLLGTAVVIIFSI